MLEFRPQHTPDSAAHKINQVACATPDSVPTSVSWRKEEETSGEVTRATMISSDAREVSHIARMASERGRVDISQARNSSPRGTATAVNAVEVELQRRLDVVKAAVEKADKVVDVARGRCAEVISREERRRAMVKLEISKLILFVGRNYNILDELELTLGSVLEVSELPVYHSDKYSEVPFSAREIPPYLSLEDLERANREMMARLMKERTKRANDPPHASLLGKRVNSNLDEVMWLIDSLEEPPCSEEQFGETVGTGEEEECEKSPVAVSQRRSQAITSTSAARETRTSGVRGASSSGNATLCSSRVEMDSSIVNFSLSSESFPIATGETRDLKLLKFMYDAAKATVEEAAAAEAFGAFSGAQLGTTFRSTSNRLQPARDSFCTQQLSGALSGTIGLNSPSKIDSGCKELSFTSSRPPSGMFEDRESFSLEQHISDRALPTAAAPWRGSHNPSTVVIDHLDPEVFTVLGELYKAYDYRQFFRDIQNKHLMRGKTDDEYEAEIENLLTQHMDDKRKRAANSVKDELIIKKWGGVASEASRAPTPRQEVEFVLPARREEEEETEEAEKKSWLQSVVESMSPLSSAPTPVEEVPSPSFLSQIPVDALVFARDMNNGVVFFIRGRNEEASNDEKTLEGKRKGKKGKAKKDGDQEDRNAAGGPPVYDSYTLYVTNQSDTNLTVVVDIEKTKARKLRMSAHVNYAIPQECIVIAPPPGSLKSLLTFCPKKRQQIDFGEILSFREGTARGEVGGTVGEEEKLQLKASSGVSARTKVSGTTKDSTVKEAGEPVAATEVSSERETAGTRAEVSDAAPTTQPSVTATTKEEVSHKEADAGEVVKILDEEADSYVAVGGGRRTKKRAGCAAILSKYPSTRGAEWEANAPESTTAESAGFTEEGEASIPPGPPRGEREPKGEEASSRSRARAREASGAANRASFQQAVGRTRETVEKVWPTGTAPVDHWGVPLSNEEDEAFEKNCVALTILQGGMWSEVDPSHGMVGEEPFGGSGEIPKEEADKLLDTSNADEEELVSKILNAPTSGDMHTLSGGQLTEMDSAEGMAAAFLGRIAAEEHLDASNFERGGVSPRRLPSDSSGVPQTTSHAEQVGDEAAVSLARKGKRVKNATSSADGEHTPRSPTRARRGSGEREGVSRSSAVGSQRLSPGAKGGKGRKEGVEGSAAQGGESSISTNETSEARTGVGSGRRADGKVGADAGRRADGKARADAGRGADGKARADAGGRADAKAGAGARARTSSDARASADTGETSDTEASIGAGTSSREVEHGGVRKSKLRSLSKTSVYGSAKMKRYSLRTPPTSGRFQASSGTVTDGEQHGDTTATESCRGSDSTSHTPRGQPSHRGVLSATRSSFIASVDDKSSWRSSVTPRADSKSVSASALKHLLDQVRVSEKKDAEAPTGFIMEKGVTEYSSLLRKGVQGVQRHLFPDRQKVCTKSNTHGRVAVYVPDDMVAGTLVSTAARDNYYGKMSRLSGALTSNGQAENIVESLRDDLHDVAKTCFVRNRRGNQRAVFGQQGGTGVSGGSKRASSYADKAGITSLPLLCAPDVVEEVRDLKVAGEEARDLFIRDPTRYDCVIDDIVQRAIQRVNGDDTNFTALTGGRNEFSIKGTGLGGARETFVSSNSTTGGSLSGHGVGAVRGFRDNRGRDVAHSNGLGASPRGGPKRGGGLEAQLAGSFQRLLDEQNRAKRIIAYVLMEMRRMWRLRRLEGDIALRAAVDRFVFRSLSFTWRIERRRVLNLNKLINLLDRRTGRVKGWVPFYTKDNVLVDHYLWEPVPPELSHQMKVVHHAMCLARRQELLPLRTVRHLSTSDQSSHHLMFGYSRRLLDPFRNTAVQLRNERRARHAAYFQRSLRRFSPQTEYLVGTPKN
ncbi:uncharacterized protein TEOVI_000475900 [Trypanosoma equiperdum]|uniref:Uncharacterized protein n=1 Tax=Trypanosoma equiperdum TaxID=5694 RepID=A0A1G4I1P0_TRYEQ|nr:hypothetical protein, conserved [Trypanosoma equiperdum]